MVLTARAREPPLKAEHDSDLISPYKRGGAGSNPAVPTKFLQLGGLFETLVGGPVTTAGNHRCMLPDGGRVPAALAAVHRGAVDDSRSKLKPEIPVAGAHHAGRVPVFVPVDVDQHGAGAYGIPLRDEIELEKRPDRQLVRPAGSRNWRPANGHTAFIFVNSRGPRSSPLHVPRGQVQVDNHRRPAMIRTRVTCDAVSYDDRVTTSSVRPVLLRDGAGIEDPLRVVLGFLKSPRRSMSVTRRGRHRSASRTSGWPRSRRSSSGANRSSEPCRRSLPALRCQQR